MLATLVLAAAFVAQAPAPASPKAVPMSVQVHAAASADAAAQAWATELRTALEARKDEFRAARKGETPELVVRIDSVGKGAGDGKVMNGTLLIGKSSHPFNLSYPGDPSPQAEKLARNLRKYVDQLKASAAPR
jgi:hypothetical protein